ncbi:exodeoxyribonuclease VII small subunit [Patescibacteria group bacterium]|nr:exodeoxyribonuclease VII small subunit [Patescibacteria group bacterium]
MSKQDKTIQEKMRELDALVAWFDGEEFNLEEAMGVYKKAEALAESIEKELAEYKNEIIVLKKKFDQV